MTQWSILDVIPLGIVVINRSFVVEGWNRWMEMYSGIPADKIEGSSLYKFYPQLNNPSFLRACRVVFTFGNVVFLSQKLHQYLFPFPLYNGNEDSDITMMQQSCSMTPIRDGNDEEITSIAITVQDVTDSVMLERKLRQTNQIDALTGAYNRRFLDSGLAEEVERHQRYKRPLSVIILDLDRFKAINDERGHLEGDRVLKGLSEVVRKVMRGSDLFCRYGGEEFVMVLPETEKASASELAERIRKDLEETAFTDGDTTYRVTASFGVVELGPAYSDAASLLKGADDHMYRAKELGRNRVYSG